MLFILFSFVGFFQLKSFIYEKRNTINPVIELISSTIISKTSYKLFSLKVSNQTKSSIQLYHSKNYGDKFDSNNIINNIILFVFESTPSQYVNIYDSTFNVTPNLKKWKSISQEAVEILLQQHPYKPDYSSNTIKDVLTSFSIDFKEIDYNEEDECFN